MTTQEIISIVDKAFYGTASGTNTYSATSNSAVPPLQSYVGGKHYYIKFTNANTGPATINIDGLGAKNILKYGSRSLAANDFLPNAIIVLVYDGTNFQVVGGVTGAYGNLISDAPYILQTKIVAQQYNGSALLVDGNVINKLASLNGFTPLDIASLIGWWDFTDMSKVIYTLVSGNVSQITDKSAAANHLVQATTTSQPVYVTSGGINDYPYVSFVSGKSLSKTLAINQPYTIFLVVRLNEFVDNSKVIDFQGNGTNGICLKSSVQGDLTLQSFGPVSNAVYQRAHFYSTDFMIVGWSINGTNTKRIFNGVIGSHTTSETGYIENEIDLDDPGSAATTKVQIGGSSMYDIHEVLFFNEAVSNINMIKIDNYLHSKYEVPEKPTLLAFGDSITVGHNSTNNLVGYVQRVAKTKGWQHFSFANSGTGLLTHLRPNYQRVINKFSKNTYITISYGSNDSIVDSVWNTNLRIVISNMISSGFIPSRIILVTPPYSSTRTAKLTTIQGYFSQAATDFGCKYADCVTATLNAGGDSLLTDGTHPGNAGHQIMADTILAVM